MPNTTATTTANTNERDIVMLVTWRERREREERERESESARVFLEPTSRDVPHALSIGRNEKERFTRTHAHTITTHNADSSPQRSTKGRINAHEKERGREPRQRTNTWSSEQERASTNRHRVRVCVRVPTCAQAFKGLREERAQERSRVEGREGSERRTTETTHAHTTTWTRGGRRGGGGGKKQESAQEPRTHREERDLVVAQTRAQGCLSRPSPLLLFSLCVCVCEVRRGSSRGRGEREESEESTQKPKSELKEGVPASNHELKRNGKSDRLRGTTTATLLPLRLVCVCARVRLSRSLARSPSCVCASLSVALVSLSRYFAASSSRSHDAQDASPSLATSPASGIALGSSFRRDATVFIERSAECPCDCRAQQHGSLCARRRGRSHERPVFLTNDSEPCSIDSQRYYSC